MSKHGSMAVAMTLRASRILLWLLVAMYGLANAAFAFTIYRLDFAWWLSGLLLVLALGLSSWALVSYLRQRHSAYLEISDTGDIIFRRLNPQHQMLSSATLSIDARTSYSEYLMILHLRAQDGAIVVYPVLRDSVSADEYRKLAIVLRWMAAHANGKEIPLLEDA